MQSECPNCKSDKSTKLRVSSPDGYSSLIHSGTGVVYPKICLKCGVLYIEKDKLEIIRESERLNYAD